MLSPILPTPPLTPPLPRISLPLSLTLPHHNLSPGLYLPLHHHNLSPGIYLPPRHSNLSLWPPYPFKQNIARVLEQTIVQIPYKKAGTETVRAVSSWPRMNKDQLKSTRESRVLYNTHKHRCCALPCISASAKVCVWARTVCACAC